MHLPLLDVTSLYVDAGTEPVSPVGCVVRFFPNTARMKMSCTASCLTKKCHKRRAGAADACIGLNGVFERSSRDRYLWIAGPLISDSMKQPGMKSSGAGPRMASSSLSISIHEFNLRKTPWVNGLATGNSVSKSIDN